MPSFDISWFGSNMDSFSALLLLHFFFANPFLANGNQHSHFLICKECRACFFGVHSHKVLRVALSFFSCTTQATFPLQRAGNIHIYIYINVNIYIYIHIYRRKASPKGAWEGLFPHLATMMVSTVFLSIGHLQSKDAHAVGRVASGPAVQIQSLKLSTW